MVSGFEQRNEQHEGLESHAERPRTRQKGGFIRRPEIKGLVRSIAIQGDENDETDAADDVGAGGTPCIGAELVLRRKHLAKHRIQAVEEDLRHAPERERIGERTLSGIPAGIQIKVGEQRGARHHDAGHRHKYHHGERDELVELILGVFLLEAAHDLRHEHGVEHAARKDGEQHLGNCGTGLVCICRNAGGTDGGSEQNGAYLPCEARGKRTHRHDGGIAPN